METRANYIAVGLFTLAAIIAAFVLIYWVGRFGDDRDLLPVDVRIQGSVSGLGAGSIVQFNGITVGRVKGLSLDEADPRYVIVHTAINKATPLRSDTKATIGIRGLSGGAFVQLEGGSPLASSLLQTSAVGGPVPRIEGDPSVLSDLLVRINGIALRTERVMDTLDGFVAKNAQTVSQTFDNAEKFSEALAANSDGVAKFMNSAGDAAKSLEQLSAKLDGSLARAEEILTAVDPQAVSRTVNNVEAFSETLSSQRQQISVLMATVATTAAELNGFSKNINSTLSKIDGVVDAIPAERIAAAVSNIDKSAERASALLDSIDPNALKSAINDAAATAASGRKLLEGVEPGAVQQTVADIGSASKKLNDVLATVEPQVVGSAVDSLSKSASRAEEILASVDTDGINKTISDAGSAAASAKAIMEGVDQDAVRTLVNNLGDASKEISELVAALDASKINTAVDNIATAAEGAQTIVSDVSKVTGPLGDRAGDIDQIVTDASQLAQRLNETSRKVDSIVSRVDNLIGAGAGDGLVADARRTLVQFRQTARSLDAQISSIAGNINSFTKRGLADTQGLIRDARQSLNGIDRVMRNLQNNPSSLITGSGGSRVRESTGSRPRR